MANVYKLFIEMAIRDNNGAFATILLPYKSGIVDVKSFEAPFNSFDKLDIRIDVNSEYNYINFFKNNKLEIELAGMLLNESKAVYNDNYSIFASLKICKLDFGKYNQVFKVNYYDMSITELEDYIEAVYNFDHDALRFLAVNYYILDKYYKDIQKAKEILELPMFENDEEARFYLFKALLIERFDGNFPDLESNIAHISWNYENLYMPLLTNGYELALFGEEEIRSDIFKYYQKLIDNNKNELLESKKHSSIPRNSFIIVYEDDKSNFIPGDIYLSKIDYLANPVFEPNIDNHKIIIISYANILNNIGSCRQALGEELELAMDDSINYEIFKAMLINPIGLPDEIVKIMKEYILNYRKKQFFEEYYKNI